MCLVPAIVIWAYSRADHPLSEKLENARLGIGQLTRPLDAIVSLEFVQESDVETPTCAGCVPAASDADPARIGAATYKPDALPNKYVMIVDDLKEQSTALDDVLESAPSLEGPNAGRILPHFEVGGQVLFDGSEVR